MTATKNKPAPDTAGEIVITRVFAAPRALVFQAWTDPVHVAQWWGPRGFTNPVCEWEARAGGRIHDVMRAPNGTDYPMDGEFREVVAPEKLVFTTGALDGTGRMMFEFLHTLIFTEQGGKTRLDLRSRLIRTTPGADKYTNGFKAGMTQSWERLAELVEGVATGVIVSSRIFTTPRAAVFAAFSDPARLAQWWGPQGFTNAFHEFDFRPGGAWRFTMRGPDGSAYGMDQQFVDIVPPERLVIHHRQSGHDFTLTVTLAARDGSTALTWTMRFADPAEGERVRPLVVPANEQNFDRLTAVLTANS